MSLTTVVLQSNYLPWIGYFDLISSADLCIFYDDVQFTKNDWRNRNVIKTKNGPTWLTIPVGQSIRRMINEVQIIDNSWQLQHRNKILLTYGNFNNNRNFLSELINFLYERNSWKSLSLLNQSSIVKISTEFLDINTKFDSSSRFELEGKGEERLLNLLELSGATEYLSGPAGKNYLTADNFKKRGIKLKFFEYPNYPTYNQIYQPFDPKVSIIDLLFSLGIDSRIYLKELRKIK
jgi:hypothetical protein